MLPVLGHVVRAPHKTRPTRTQQHKAHAPHAIQSFHGTGKPCLLARLITTYGFHHAALHKTMEFRKSMTTTTFMQFEKW